MTIASKSILKAGTMLAVFSFAADLVALLRDRLLASHFGASRALDIYYSSFRIPDLIFNLLILGTVSSAFIPVFIEHYRRDQEEAWHLSNNFLSVACAGVVIVSGIIFVFARPLSSLIAPGFSGEDKELVIRLTRLMLLSPLIFSISNVVGSILQSLEKFFAYAIAPVLYNAGIIAGIIYFVPLMKARGWPEVIGLGLGVVFGAILHLMVQIPPAVMAGFKFKPVFSLAHQGMRRVLKLMIPRTIGLGAYGLNTVITNAFASLMAVGSITIYNLADSIQFVPIAVVGVSVATAVFPRLSHYASGQEMMDFHRKVSQTLKAVLAVIVPSAAGMFIFREKIISILFGVGLFKGFGVEETAKILGIFMFGVVAHSLIPTVSRAFYALQNTKTPVIVSLIGIAVNIALASYFTFILGWNVRGLAVAYAISTNLHFLLLFWAFKVKFPVKS